VKLKVCLSLAMAVLLATGAGMSEATKLHPAGGLLFQDPYTVPGLKVVDESTVPRGAPRTEAPSAIDLTSEMPPVGDQGSQNSCVAWAVGYYDKTHVEYIERTCGWHIPWDLTDPAHQISPSFIYNQINAGRDGGAQMNDAQIIICQQGASMLSDCPYYDYDYTSWPSESAYAHAIWYRGQQGWAINVMSDVGINQVRLVMANHNTCVLGINVYANFDNIQNYDTVYTVHDKTGRSRGGHAICLVGYDDNKVTADGTGAFRFVNSWGEDWGHAGYGWISYYAVKTTRAGLSQGFVYVTDDRYKYEVKALARVKLTHPARDRIGIGFGVGSSKNPLWNCFYRGFWILQGTITDRPFPNNNMVFDLTYGAPYLDQTESVYARCIDNKKDGKKGSIDFFSVEYSGRYGYSGQQFLIPDYNVAVYDKVVLPFAFGPQGNPLAGSVAVSRASYRSGAARISFNLTRPGTVKITFFDDIGRTVAAATAPGQSGPNELSARLPASAGVYFYRLESGPTAIMGKLAAIR